MPTHLSAGPAPSWTSPRPVLTLRSYTHARFPPRVSVRKAPTSNLSRWVCQLRPLAHAARGHLLVGLSELRPDILLEDLAGRGGLGEQVLHRPADQGLHLSLVRYERHGRGVVGVDVLEDLELVGVECGLTGSGLGNGEAGVLLVEPSLLALARHELDELQRPVLVLCVIEYREVYPCGVGHDRLASRWERVRDRDGRNTVLALLHPAAGQRGHCAGLEHDHGRLLVREVRRSLGPGAVLCALRRGDFVFRDEFYVLLDRADYLRRVEGRLILLVEERTALLSAEDEGPVRVLGDTSPLYCEPPPVRRVCELLGDGKKLLPGLRRALYPRLLEHRLVVEEGIREPVDRHGGGRLPRRPGSVVGRLDELALAPDGIQRILVERHECSGCLQRGRPRVADVQDVRALPAGDGRRDPVPQVLPPDDLDVYRNSGLFLELLGDLTEDLLVLRDGRSLLTRPVA